MEIKKIRNFLWRILGVKYDTFLIKMDYTLLRDDSFVEKGCRSYDNGAKVWRWTNAPLIIGKYCSIANNVNFIIDEGHHTLSNVTNFPLTKSFLIEDNKFSDLKQKEGIIIGNDVWIGMGSYIMPGVKIGNGVTIAANSVVTNDVEDYCVVGGTPARLIKKKFDDTIIYKLNIIKWWDWKEKEVENRIEDFHSSIIFFVNKYYKSEN